MFLMPRAWLNCLIISIALIGCTNGGRAKVASVKTVFIENARPSSNQTAETLSSSVSESVAIELTRRGYVVMDSKKSAEGILRVTWQVSPTAVNNSNEYPMSLSMTLFNQKGQRIFSGNSGPAVPSAFWNKTRARAEVASILARMPSSITALE